MSHYVIGCVAGMMLDGGTNVGDDAACIGGEDNAVSMFNEGAVFVLAFAQC